MRARDSQQAGMQNARERRMRRLMLQLQQTDSWPRAAGLPEAGPPSLHELLRKEKVPGPCQGSSNLGQTIQDCHLKPNSSIFLLLKQSEY